MPDDARTVPVTFQLDPETATALEEPATRARVERLVARMVRPASPERGSVRARANMVGGVQAVRV